jgi:hypothetical protein
MKHVRPQRIFDLLDEPPSERVVQWAIPFQQGTGGTTLLENMLLVAGLRIVKAKRVFEFGTFFGRTTFNLALNLPEDGELFTLELGEDEIGVVPQSDVNAACTKQRAEDPRPMDYHAHTCAKKITRLRGDSRKFDFSPYEYSIELVFVDGGHEVKTVIADTRSALHMVGACTVAHGLVACSRPSCVIWHDYGNPNTLGVTAYLNEINLPGIVHIEDTLLCAWFSDPGMQAKLME